MAAALRACTLLCLVGPRVLADNLALLSDTLRTVQQAGCYDQLVALRCPHGTTISVHMAQYSRQPPADPPCPPRAGNTTCNWPDALQVVVEACQKKRQCKFRPSPKSFGVDPCPGVRKYVEVSYKCRPYEFRSKVVCEHDVVQLECNPNSRLAVYSASFGRTEYESLQCPQAAGAPEETCLVSYATETVMRACHGKRRCTLAADAATFGSPCRPQTRMYLKAVYTCGRQLSGSPRCEGLSSRFPQVSWTGLPAVPRQVLKDDVVESERDEDELLPGADDQEDDLDYDKGEFFRESAFVSPSPNQEKARDDPAPDGDPPGGKPPPGGSRDRPGPGALDNLPVYLALCAAAALLLLTGLVLGRLLARRRPAPDGGDAAAGADQTLPRLAVAETALDLACPAAPADDELLFGPKAAAALRRWQQADPAAPAAGAAPLGLDRGDGAAQFLGR